MSPQQAMARQRRPRRLDEGAAQWRDKVDNAEHYDRILAEWPEIVAAVAKDGAR